MGPIRVERAPVVGRVYSVICPVCSNNVTFDCLSRSVYGIQCHFCHTVIDLRNPSVPLPPNDTGVLAEHVNGDFFFSPEVEESGRGSATTQLSMVLADFAEQQQKEMPTTMGGEARQAFSARRIQALSERFSFLYPLVHVIEYIVFGTKPVARIGHVRIFRKRLLFFWPVNIPVTKTSVSYSAPLTVAILLYLMITFYTKSLDDEWMWCMQRYTTFFLVLFMVLLVCCVYTDPGFVRPAYLETNGSHMGELTLKEIEAKQRESRWEMVNGQPEERKWCSTCEIYRPVRAAHCYLCGLCVHDHDHHCSVIGVCVGRRNVRVFLFFVINTALLALLPGLSLLLKLFLDANSLTARQLGIGLLLMAVLLGLGLVVGFLSLTILYSLAVETTTRERLQNSYANKKNPFNRGLLRNILWHMCYRSPPSLFDDDFVQLCATQA
ncbi:putative palmitoyl acyltransferase 4 [Trypanosoma cruzi]|uniref:Palmitoyltransferase n=2 Tax=Trypanosoma cruzi TaxID=5693 RepID=Q4CW76_TRYCC|nr:hypothetical protein, conserved [Trypanosoma cruzi]EAN84524.1 hypothetical protein, conserved [Trypanosoma cruzi]PWV19322.1 putative palmitoyl acyltransferase 4 [Trypanosoma cruzi]RNC52930.1 S-acyltransferase [Trypanosoma cruzi]|eukprot:XP_806375.1 hypothetical protein [Trypanosoma cruzi strain CL Brener]